MLAYRHFMIIIISLSAVRTALNPCAYSLDATMMNVCAFVPSSLARYTVVFLLHLLIIFQHIRVEQSVFVCISIVARDSAIFFLLHPILFFFYFFLFVGEARKIVRMFRALSIISIDLL